MRHPEAPERGAPGHGRTPAGEGWSDTGSRVSFGLASVVWLLTGIGFCLNAAAIAESSRGNAALGEGLFWVSIIVPFVVQAALLLAAHPSPRLRQVIVCLVGVYPALLYRLTSPLVLGNYDEHLHERALSDLLHGSGLFAPNPMLPVGPYYPGLELFTGALVRLTGMPPIVAMNLVPILCRLLLVLSVYFLAITFLRSDRAASLVVVFYATSPQFFNFNSKFSYQTIALTLGMGGVVLLRRAQFKRAPAAPRLMALATIVFLATVISHHLTSWLFFGFLVIWAVVSPRGRRKVVAQVAAVTGLAIAIWTAAISSKLSGYLGPVFSAALHEVAGTLGGTSQGRVFSSSGGYVTPEWQKMLLFLYAIVCTIAALWYGGRVLLRGIRERRLPLAVLGVMAMAYPGTLAAHFVPAASDIGDRASTFLFFWLALCVAYAIRNGRSSRQSRSGTLSRRFVITLTTIVSLAYFGGIILGSGLAALILPGPYGIEAGARSQDAQTLTAVKWASEHIPPGSRVVADLNAANLLSSQARLWPIISPSGGLAPAYLYFSETWDTYQAEVVKNYDIRYIYVDARLADGLPVQGMYFYAGEISPEQRLNGLDLSKFAHVPGLKAAYHQGPISIYSTAGLGVPAIRDGYTGNRSIGFGTIGDFVLGLILAGLIFALRSRLRWIGAAARDAGGVGVSVTLMAVTILLSSGLFELGLMPGPAFTVGAVCAVAAGVVISRFTASPVRLPRFFSFRQIEPMSLIGVVLALGGILLAVNVAWNMDITQVNELLKNVSG